MYSSAEQKKIRLSGQMGTASSQSGSEMNDGIPNSVMASMMGRNKQSGSSVDDLGDQLRSRLPVAQAQIPAAEDEADRLSASVRGTSPEEVKADMGRKMGADFSGVRFHTDAQAEQSATSMGARAYAKGNDVYFGKGGFDAQIAAHELVHTVQQGAVSGEGTMSTPAGEIQMWPWSKKKGNAKVIASTPTPDVSNYKAGAMQTDEGVLDHFRNGGAMRGLNSKAYNDMIDPILSPWQQMKKDYLSSLKKNGMDYSKAGQMSTYHAEHLGNTNYNDDTIAATKGILSMMDEYMGQDEVQKSISTLAQAHNNNWDKRLATTKGGNTQENRDSYLIKQFLSKGFGNIPKNFVNGADPKNKDEFDFTYRGVMTNLGNLEGLRGKLDDPDLPEQLKDLVAAYEPVRNRFMSAIHPAEQTNGENTSAQTMAYRSDEVGKQAADPNVFYNSESTDNDQINLGLRRMYEKIKNPGENDSAEYISSKKREFAQARAAQLKQELDEKQRASAPAPAPKPKKKWYQFWKK